MYVPTWAIANRYAVFADVYRREDESLMLKKRESAGVDPSEKVTNTSPLGRAAHPTLLRIIIFAARWGLVSTGGK
jgi:hypothetical protein